MKKLLIIISLVLAILVASRVGVVLAERDISSVPAAVEFNAQTPSAIVLAEPVVTFKVTGMILGSNPFDHYKCQQLSPDSTKCLDLEPNPPVRFDHASIYGAPSPTISVRSFDLDEGSFGMTVQGATQVALNGSCVVADVNYQEVWLDVSILYDSHLRYTVCYSGEIWYFQIHV